MPIFLRVLVFIIFFLVNIIRGSPISSSLSESDCAVLSNTNPNHLSLPLFLGKESSFSDFESEFINSTNHWEFINAAVQIQNGCLFTSCSGSYFTGECTKFDKEMGNIGRVLSANCSCQQNCTCKDELLKINKQRNGCARAYFSPQGCGKCHSEYFQLNKGEFDFTSEINITSIVVSDGCKLTLLQDFEPHILEGGIHNWMNTIDSYKCICDKADVTLNSALLPFTQTTAETLIRLPSHDTRNNNRSGRNAYVLLLGSTGAGKSSTINTLLGLSNLASVGAGTSITSSIFEYIIPIPSSKSNQKEGSSLHIIDTPGLGDTRGLEHDAQFLATLDQYLSNHTELQHKLPNVVLVFHKFSDNRYRGHGSQFVKMLRSLNYFNDKLADPNYSNIIFVFSHMASELKETQRNPKEKLKSFQNVIEEFSEFPKPIVMALVENKASEMEFPMVDGYYRLPNGEDFTKSLFHKIQRSMMGSNDSVGSEIISTAFSRNINSSTIQSQVTEIVPRDDPKVTKFLYLMLRASYQIVDSEIVRALDNAHEMKLNASMKQRYPEAVYHLQLAFARRNITKIDDIPRTTFGIVDLLKDLILNDGILSLLKSAFSLRLPPYPEDILVGQGYSLLKDVPLSKLSSPFQLGSLRGSSIVFRFPMGVTVNKLEEIKDIHHIFKSIPEYISFRRRITGNIEGTAFSSMSLKPGYNIMESSSFGILSGVRELRKFKLTLNDQLKLSDTFINSLNSIGPLNLMNYSSVENFNEFFREYGTHVIKSAYGGGSIEIHAKSPIDRIQLFSTVSGTASGIDHILLFHGGDKSQYTSDLSQMTRNKASQLLQDWETSIRVYPTMLRNDLELIPLSEVVKNHFRGELNTQSLSSDIEKGILLFLNSELKYSPKLYENKIQELHSTFEKILKEKEQEHLKFREHARNHSVMAQEKCQEIVDGVQQMAITRANATQRNFDTIIQVLDKKFQEANEYWEGQRKASADSVEKAKRFCQEMSDENNKKIKEAEKSYDEAISESRKMKIKCEAAQESHRRIQERLNG